MLALAEFVGAHHLVLVIDLRLIFVQAVLHDDSRVVLQARMIHCCYKCLLWSVYYLISLPVPALAV